MGTTSIQHALLCLKAPPCLPDSLVPRGVAGCAARRPAVGIVHRGGNCEIVQIQVIGSAQELAPTHAAGTSGSGCSSHLGTQLARTGAPFPCMRKPYGAIPAGSIVRHVLLCHPLPCPWPPRWTAFRVHPSLGTLPLVPITPCAPPPPPPPSADSVFLGCQCGTQQRTSLGEEVVAERGDLGGDLGEAGWAAGWAAG